MPDQGDQRPIDLQAEAQRYWSIDADLRQRPSAAWDELVRLFNHLEEAYNLYIKKTKKWGTRDTPLTLTQWVQQTAKGSHPHPDDDDLRKMQRAEAKNRGCEEAAFYRRWYRLLDYADEWRRGSQVAPAEAGLSTAHPSASIGGGEQLRQQDYYAAEPDPRSAYDQRGATGPYQSGAAPYAPPPAPPAPQTQFAQVTGYTGELAVIQQVRERPSHPTTIQALDSAAQMMLSGRQALRKHLEDLNDLLKRYWDESERLKAAAAEIAASQWVSYAIYQDKCAAYDKLAREFESLLSKHRGIGQEAGREKQAREDAERAREKARLQTANLLMQEARSLWNRFNMRAGEERRGSDHDSHQATEIYAELLHILDSACGVRALDIRQGQTYDRRTMEYLNDAGRAKDKQLRGCVAWVEEPGFEDATDVISRAKVAVYADE